MFLLGLIALLQIGLLPGLLALQVISAQRSLTQTTMFSFGLSLLANTILVFVLTLLHLYTSNVIALIVIVEILLLIYLTRVSPIVNERTVSQPILKNPARIAAVFSIIWLCSFYVYGDPTPKSIFSLWDAIVSWNRWAMEWSHNAIPQMTAEYPQLIPSNVSLTYLLMGNTTIQLFGKLLFYAFPLMMIVCLWDLAKRYQQAAYYWSIAFVTVFLVLMFGELSVSGYADIPVASLSLLAVYAVLICRQETSARVIKQNILIGTLICAGAALTKQAGILLAVIYPVLVYLLALKETNTLMRDAKMRCIRLSIILLLITILPWYLFKYVQIKMSIDTSMALALMQGGGHHALAHPTLINRLIFAFQLCLEGFHLPFKIINAVFVITLVLAACLADRVARIITLLLVIPMFFVWAGFFSYDMRNMAFVIPFVSIVLGFGLQQLLSMLCQWKVVKNHNLMVFSAALFVIITLCLVYQDDRLLMLQSDTEKQMGNSEVNNTLYAYFDKVPSKQKILTNYKVLQYLPDLASHYISYNGESITELQSLLKTQKSAYILLLKVRSQSSWTTIPLENYLQAHSQQFVKIFENNDFVFYQSQVG